MRSSTAGMAKATAGRARTFAGKKEKLAALNTVDSEIDEGLEEYAEKKTPNAVPEKLVTMAVNLQVVIGLAFDKLDSPEMKQAIIESMMASVSSLG